MSGAVGAACCCGDTPSQICPGSCNGCPQSILVTVAPTTWQDAQGAQYEFFGTGILTHASSFPPTPCTWHWTDGSFTYIKNGDIVSEDFLPVATIGNQINCLVATQFSPPQLTEGLAYWFINIGWQSFPGLVFYAWQRWHLANAGEVCPPLGNTEVEYEIPGGPPLPPNFQTGGIFLT